MVMMITLQEGWYWYPFLLLFLIQALVIGNRFDSLFSFVDSFQVCSYSPHSSSTTRLSLSSSRIIITDGDQQYKPYYFYHWNIHAKKTAQTTPSSLYLSPSLVKSGTTTTTLFESAKGIDAADNNKGGGTVTLTLAGNVEISSKPLPLPSNTESFTSFVNDPKNRNVFVTAGGTRPWKTIDMKAATSSSLLESWKDACVEVGADFVPDEDNDNNDNNNDCGIVEVRTSGIKFPGLQLESLARIGIMNNNNSNKKNKDTDIDNNEDETVLYEFVLLGDEQKVSGLPPTVWIYNKLTGNNNDSRNNKKKDSSKQEQSATSLSKISCKKVKSDDGTTDMVVFKSKANLNVRVKFPAFLLKILPTNKEKAEETGGKSIAKALQKDVQASIDGFEKVYLEQFN